MLKYGYPSLSAFFVRAIATTSFQYQDLTVESNRLARIKHKVPPLRFAPVGMKDSNLEFALFFST